MSTGKITTRRIAPVAAAIAACASALAIAVWGREGAVVAATIATAGATVVLAWVTGRLVTVTREMASEPAIVPSLFVYAGHVFLELLNAGDGAERPCGAVGDMTYGVKKCRGTVATHDQTVVTLGLRVIALGA